MIKEITKLFQQDTRLTYGIMLSETEVAAFVFEGEEFIYEGEKDKNNLWKDNMALLFKEVTGRNLTSYKDDLSFCNEISGATKISGATTGAVR